MNGGMRVLIKARGAAESTRTKNGGKLRKAASAVALATMCTAATVQAEPIIFSFNCTLVNSTTCTPGPQVATMTLSDSAIDRNRIDIDLIVSPATGATSLNRLYLNYGGSLWIEGRYFSLVRQDAVQRFRLDEAPNAVLLDKLGPSGSQMDIALDLSNPQLEIFGMYTSALTLSTSLVHSPNLDTFDEGDLNAAAFQVKNPNNLLYALLEMSTPTGSLYAGATLAYRPSDLDVPPIGNINLPSPPDTIVTEPSSAVVQAALPEPGTLGLLGVAAAFLGSAIGLKKRSRA